MDGISGDYRPASTVRHALIDGHRIILDLNTETYRVLDPVGSAMWSTLAGDVDWPEAKRSLLDRFEVAPDILDRDIANFAARCRTEGLLTRGEPPVPTAAIPDTSTPHLRRRGPFPATLHAIRALYATRHALARDGFRTTYERYSRFPAGSDASGLNAALEAFGRAEHVFVASRAPDDCLIRSLALFRFLRELGHPAEHVIGVCRVPFQAHAWVECDGEPLRDERTRSGAFSPLARLANKSGSFGTAR